MTGLYGIGWVWPPTFEFFALVLFEFIFEYFSPMLGYYLGYRYQRTGKQVSRSVYLLWALLLVFPFIVAVHDGISTIDLPITLWLLSRALVIRTLWLVKIREGYLFLLLHAVSVFACTSSNNAMTDAFFIFIQIHAVVFFLGVCSLFRDQNTNRKIPSMALLQGIAASALLALFFILTLPSGKYWDFQVLPLHHEDGKPTNLSGGLDPSSSDSDKISRMVTRPLENFGLSQLSLPRIPWFILLLLGLLILVVMLLWHFRERLLLAAAVVVTDPLRIAFISDKTSHNKNDMWVLFGAYERLWHYKGLKREASMTPIEHLFIIAKESKDLVKPSMKILQAFQALRYGARPAKQLEDEIRSYLLLRNTIAPEVLHLFGKNYQE